MINLREALQGNLDEFDINLRCEFYVKAEDNLHMIRYICDKILTNLAKRDPIEFCLNNPSSRLANDQGSTKELHSKTNKECVP